MNAADRKRIAALYPGRFAPHYVASKLRSDPLYTALLGEIQGSGLPLLDLGCGLGLVAFFLRASGEDFPIFGIDYDRRKIELAERAAARSGETGLRFALHDLHTGVPDHRGNVCLLDTLQYLDSAAQSLLLDAACACVAPGGKLIIRAGLRDDSLRFKLSQLGDRFTKATFWMKGGPKHFLTADDFTSRLTPHGEVRITPLWGGTPFNNHLIVLEKPAAG